MSDNQLDRVSSIEIRQLRQTVHALADAVDELSAEIEEQTSKGRGGPPEHAQNAKKACESARKLADPPLRDQDKIKPPWEREGYASKSNWLVDK